MKEWRESLPTPKECIKTIHQADGIAILARPILLGLDDDKLKMQLEELKNLELDGIEINHPNQTEEYREMLREYAKEMKFLVSGGSDYHGKIKNTAIWIKDSDTVIFYKNIEDMKKRIAGRRK